MSEDKLESERLFAERFVADFFAQVEARKGDGTATKAPCPPSLPCPLSTIWEHYNAAAIIDRLEDFEHYQVQLRQMCSRAIKPEHYGHAFAMELALLVRLLDYSAVHRLKLEVPELAGRPGMDSITLFHIGQKHTDTATGITFIRAAGHVMMNIEETEK